MESTLYTVFWWIYNLRLTVQFGADRRGPQHFFEWVVGGGIGETEGNQLLFDEERSETRGGEGRVAELAIGRCRRSSINCFLFFTVTYQQKRTEEPFALRSSVHSFRHYACATNSRKSSSKPTWARYTIHRFSVRKLSHTRTLWTFLDDLQDQPTVLPPFSNFHRRDVRRAK